MILAVIGLLVLAVAAVVAVAGIFTNTGAAHELTNAFSVFGHQVTGSTGMLFLAGIAVGAVGVLGLGLLLAGARRASRRGSAARHGPRDSRREAQAVGRSRDDLADQRDGARAEATSASRDSDALARQWDELMSGRSRATREQTAGTRVAPMPPEGGGTPHRDDGPDGNRGLRLFGHRSAFR